MNDPVERSTQDGSADEERASPPEVHNDLRKEGSAAPKAPPPATSDPQTLVSDDDPSPLDEIEDSPVRPKNS